MPRISRDADARWTLRLNSQNWLRQWQRLGIEGDEAISHKMGDGFSRNTVTRVRAGEFPPSPAFIATTLRLFPACSFDELFLIVHPSVIVPRRAA